MLKTIFVLVLVAVIAAGSVFLIMQYTGKTDVNITVEGIKKIAQLATVEYTLSEVLTHTIPKKWFEWQDTTYIVMVSGKVKGSVDLKKMQMEVSNDPDKKEVYLRFEEGAVLISDAEIDPESWETISCDVNVFTSISEEVKKEKEREAMRNLREAALEMGIKENTISEAKLVLSQFLQELGYEAHIEFADEDIEITTSDTNP